MLKITLKCVSCKNKRELTQAEIDEKEQPMCEKCFMPMFVDKAEVNSK